MNSVFIWKAGGPYSVEDLPEEEEYPEGFSHWLVCLVTEGINIEPSYEELWFHSFDDAYALKNKVDMSMEPLEVSNE